MYITSNPKCCIPCIPIRIPKREMILISISGDNLVKRLMLHVMITNINNIKSEITNQLCYKQSVSSETDKYNVSCSYNTDSDITLVTTNNMNNSSSVTISLNDMNTISETLNINLNMYSIYGTVEDTLSLIYGGNNINYNYIETVTRNNMTYNVNMVGFDSESDNNSKFRNNKLNFNVEIVDFSNRIYESNIINT